ncbi:MAG: hypothetical protein QOD86_1880 [Miltoncostaeaceae bacterium]|nr:hypothetical protein [Miltoncostaeaceae bacterium]
MQRLDVTLLGGFGVAVDGRVVPAEAWTRRRGRDLVKLLALAPGHRLVRDQALEALWPHLDAPAALANLHKAAHLARVALGDEGAVVLRGGQVALAPDALVEVDAERFATTGDPALYAGDLLPEDRYEEWAAAPRERLRETYLACLRAGGRWEELARVEPADEAAQCALARRDAGGGDLPAALARLARLRAALAGLGRLPGTEARGLQAELARGAAVAAPALDAGPLLGRDGELDVARAALRRARERRGGTLIVRGEAGIGKTRLCEAILAEARASGWTTLRGAAREEEGGVPYAPIAEALERLLIARPDLLDALPDAAADELARLTPAVARPAPAHPPDRQRIFSAVGQLLAAMAREGGVALLLEDLHAADEATLQLVHYLARTARLQPVLLIVNHRDAGSPSLAALRAGLLERRAGEELALGPLEETAAAALVEWSAAHPPAPATAGAILQLAGGNPFFLQELAAAVVPDGTAGVPGRLYEALNARLALLATPLRRFVEELAVAGAAFEDVDEVAAAAEIGEAELLERLDDAVAAGVLVARGPAIAFRHAIVREGVLRAMPGHRRALAHRAAARRLIGAGAPAARVAHHLLEGGRSSEAVGWLDRAARQAAALGAFADARRLADTALAHATPEESAGLRALHAELLLATGDPGAAAAFEAALAALGDAAPPGLRAGLARARLAIGAIGAAAEAVASVAAPDRPQRIQLLVTRGIVAWFAGDMSAAGRDARTARRLASEAGLEGVLPDVVQLQAMVAHATGRWSEDLWRDLRDSLRDPARAAGIFDGYFCVGEYVLASGRPMGELSAFAGELRDGARRWGARRAEAFAMTLLGEAALIAGLPAAAEADLAEAAELAREVGTSTGEALALLRRAEALAALGRRDEAEPLFARAVEVGQQTSVPAHAPFIVHAARIAAERDPAVALAHLDEAEALTAGPARCPVCPTWFHVAAAGACAAAGLPDRARAHLGAGERHAGMWPTGPWPAAIGEARAAIALAEGDAPEAARLLAESADAFATWGRPLDESRVRSRIAALA